jgi:hypothetical protein
MSKPPRLSDAGLRSGLISQARFPCGRHAGEIRSDVLGREVGVQVDSRPDGSVRRSLVVRCDRRIS